MRLRIRPANYPIGLMRHPKVLITYPIPPTAYLIEPVVSPIRKIVHTKLQKG